MARILEKLRPARLPVAPRALPLTVPEPAPVRPPAVEPGAEVEGESAGAIPYIEVGAQRYFEASPEVLATIPKQPGTAGERPGAGAAEPVRRRLAPELAAYHAPGQPASAGYSDLLRALLEAPRGRVGGPCRTLLLTSAHPGIGTTTVLLNLAITAARQDRHVVVVDANLRRAAVSDRLGLPPTPGLTEVLAGEILLPDALQVTAQENLVMLASGGPAALLADEASVRGLVGQLAEGHDLVLIDGPRIEHPVPAVGRAWDGRAMSLLASVCQAMYLVVPRAEADSAATAELAAGLSARALPLVGCIVAG